MTWDLPVVRPVHRCLCFLDRLQGPGGEHTPAGKSLLNEQRKDELINTPRSEIKELIGAWDSSQGVSEVVKSHLPSTLG